MPIVATEIVSITPRKGGLNRVVFEYEFTDGRKTRRRNCSVPDGADLVAEGAKLAPKALAQMQRLDTIEAVSQGLATAYGEATEKQVQFQLLYRGYNEPEDFLAYSLMKDVAPALLSLDLTDEQYASLMNSTVEEVQNVKAKWAYLEAKKDALEAYIAARG